VHGRAWRETKVACCLSLSSSPGVADPQPEPPSAFRDPQRVRRLVAELARRTAGAGPPPPTTPGGRRRRRRPRRRVRVRVRAVVATPADSEAFGWQMMAEVHRRRLDQAGRKACVCDGQAYNWALFEMHLRPAGFVPILDVVHLVSHLHTGAAAVAGADAAEHWAIYSRWLSWAWAGQVGEVRRELRAAAMRLGDPPAGVREDDPREVVRVLAGYLATNADRMAYPRYRCLGLPISSAAVESTIKQVNRRVKGSEKFWLGSGAEAILQLRAAHISQDGRAERLAARPRPRGRAVGRHRLQHAA
jgi:hypothetical protein